MIKVIVAIAGLALVEAPPNGPIDIHLPETEGFANVTPLLSSGKPLPFAMDDHDVTVEVGAGTGSQVIADPVPFRLTLTLPTAGTPDLSAKGSFPDLKGLVPQRPAVREDCAFGGPDPLGTCRGRGATGAELPLLAGQVRLVGPWELMAAETPASRREPVDAASTPGHLLRLLVDDALRSRIHTSSTGARFADTFLFVGAVENLGELSITGQIDQQTVELFQPAASVCALVGGPCRMLWVENSPTCGQAGSACVDVGTFLKPADTHFAQLYRLLDSYEPEHGTLADEVFVPFGAHHGLVPPLGDGSPRCYGGITAP